MLRRTSCGILFEVSHRNLAHDRRKPGPNRPTDVANGLQSLQSMLGPLSPLDSIEDKIRLTCLMQ